ncbi:hypothetical protein AALB19_05330 [Oscillospiraceae bacterium 50-58]
MAGAELTPRYMVRIETLDGTLYIQALFGEPICEHHISSGQGLLIQSMSHRRDRTSKLDKLLAAWGNTP